MKVFLSHAMSPHDAPIAARLRAVAAAYDIQILLPDRTRTLEPTAETLRKIKQSDAVVALITTQATQTDAVNRELQAATQANKPIIALVENPNQVQGVAKSQVVKFDRTNPTAHERHLLTALKQMRRQQKQAEISTALGWIAGIALGLVALSALTADE
jgi:TIR domain-containing protein